MLPFIPTLLERGFVYFLLLWHDVECSNCLLSTVPHEVGEKGGGGRGRVGKLNKRVGFPLSSGVETCNTA